MFLDIYNKIKEFDTIVICRHVGVDPDALCGQLGLRDSIKLTFPEKKVLAVGTGSARFTKIGKLDKLEKVENALLIVVDTPDIKRIDSADFSQFSCIIKIDHHPFMEKFGDIEYIEDTCSSCCEIIINMIENTELKCDKNIAETLFIGMVSDSNRFLFNSCTSKTFLTVSKLLDKYPFDLSEQYDKLYSRPLSEVRLEGFIATNMIVTDNGLGYCIIDNDTITKLGVDSASAGNMVNNFNYIDEVIVWATITEDIKNNQFRVSIRSRGPEINKVAEKYNGGGHKMASGAKPSTLEEAMKIMDELDLLLEIYNRGEDLYGD